MRNFRSLLVLLVGSSILVACSGGSTPPAARTVTPTTPAGIFSEVREPSSGGMLQGITSGPDGNLWFTEGQSSKIGRISPSGIISEFVPPGHPGPDMITAGPDGNLWFTESSNVAIGRITSGK